MTPLPPLRDAPAEPRPGAWAPLRFPADEPAAVAEVERLIAERRAIFVHDTLDLQLAELVDSRTPGHKLQGAELARAVDAFLEGRPSVSYGNWFYYPWSGRLIRVLPEGPFRWLRSNRNRNKITEPEQASLRLRTLGIVGLSVGSATAMTLAMEGVGGTLRLADFDSLDLGNLNRLRAPLHALGENKAVIAARQIAELDPYLRVEVFAEGVTEANLERFLLGDGAEGWPRLDLLIEECDDLYLKVALRERARAAQIPVVMETSDRGLVDIERFDLEPERPLLHGLVGDLKAESLRGLTTYEKVPIVLQLLGEDAVSPRLAASMVEIDSTLKTWPQLASAVSLGAALGTDVARRILLDQLRISGRFYVDLEQAIPDSPGEAGAPASRPAEREGADAAPARTPGPPRVESRGDLGSIRSLVALAVLAPSGGNCQPWRFSWNGERLRCHHDRARSASFLDWEDKAAHLALGAAVENMILGAGALGLALRAEPFPLPGDAAVVCDLWPTASPGGPVDDPLAAAIPLRCTNRRLGPRAPLEPRLRDALSSAAGALGVELSLVEEPATLERLGRLLGRGDRIRFLNEQMHREMMSEIRWSEEEARRTGDGMDVATLELTPTDLAGMKLTRGWRVMELVGRVGGGRALEKPSRKALAAASAAGLVRLPGRGPGEAFLGGRAMQRVWLAATAAGWAFQPMTAITYLFERLIDGGEGLSRTERAELEQLWLEHQEIFGTGPGETQAMLFRLARAEPPTERALRRPVEEVFSIE
ncbi:MAG: Rv1355c family protein [Deltaproteobacteria bacterium]|nr:Rv1355c family protein [Deltaproteobacteria bacterium]